ncbi:MAG: alkaline phosphatase D family protein [Acidobacteriota bacterium]
MGNLARHAVVALTVLSSAAAAEETLLHAGPMLAATELRSTAIWVQTASETAVQLRYFPAGVPEAARLTPEARTCSSDELVKAFTLAGLEPGGAYEYELYLDGHLVARPYPLTFTTLPLWQWRTPPPDFAAMFGSCAYINEDAYDRPGRPYGSEYEIFAAMAAARPDLMLWLGDNLYYREADLFSASGLAHRYRHDRALPELQPFLAATAHLAIWDDHDFGPNDSDGSYGLKDASLALFKLYWPAATRGLPGVPGVFHKVTWGDVDFFLLDDRYHRKPNGWPQRADKTMLGRAQLEWLKESLVSSHAAFKVIALGNQVLNPLSEYETMAHYAAEQKELVDWIVGQRIDGVVFISGDRHHSELIRLQPAGAYPLYDFTSSSLTAGVHEMKEGHPELANPHRVAGTLVMAHSFGMLRFSGAARQRVLTMQACDRSGKVLWEHQIRQDEVSFPKPPQQGRQRRR